MPSAEIKFQFRVSETGDIKIINRKEFEKQMRELFSGKTVVATFRKPRKQRSTQQNSFYFGILIPEIIDGLVNNGFDRHSLTVELVHDMLRDKFLKVDVPSTEFAGEFITLTRSSKDLTTAEWMDYTTDIERWSQEFLGIRLSQPNEQKEMDLL